MNYLILNNSRNTNSDQIEKYYAIQSDDVETVEIHNTNDPMGKPRGHNYAKDLTLSNDKDLMNDLKSAIARKFRIAKRNIDIREYKTGLYRMNPGDGQLYGFDEEVVNSFIAEFCKKNEVIRSCDAVTYFDGHGWRTILIEDFKSDLPTSISRDAFEISDGRTSKSINLFLDELVNRKDDFFVKDNGSETFYQNNNYIVAVSSSPSVWAKYIIYDRKTVEVSDIINK